VNGFCQFTKAIFKIIFQYIINFVNLSRVYCLLEINDDDDDDAFVSMSAQHMYACVYVVINEKYKQVNKIYHNYHTH